MPGDPHPAETAFESHDAVEIAAFDKLHHRLVVADPDFLRNIDASGQFGGVYVRSLDANFSLDTEDVQLDDGVNVIIDAAGNHFVRIAVSVSEVEKEITATGDVTLADDETADQIYINNTSGGAISVFLPSSTTRTKRIRIIDGADNAGTHAITVMPKAGSGETVFGVSDGSLSTIDSNASSIELKPRSDGSGYR
jgi:hypothetical protein